MSDTARSQPNPHNAPTVENIYARQVNLFNGMYMHWSLEQTLQQYAKNWNDLVDAKENGNEATIITLDPIVTVLEESLDHPANFVCQIAVEA